MGSSNWGYSTLQKVNPSDPYAVATLNGIAVVGYMPRVISAVCSAFIRGEVVASCEVTGGRQYSADLPQGGMEVPCKVTFTAPVKEINKVRRLPPRGDSKETNCPVNLCKPDTAAVVPAVVINPTSAIATDNLEDKPKPNILDIKPEPSTLDVKPEPSKVEPTDVPSDNEPLKKKPQINSSSGASVAEEIWLKLGKNILTWGIDKFYVMECSEQCLLKDSFRACC